MANFTGRHRWGLISRGLPFHYCVKCGIISLRNRASQKVVQRPCKDQAKDDD